MKWIGAVESDFRGALPVARSGHTAARIRKNHVVIFGGLADKKFLQDLAVLDTENNVWFEPECTGSGSDGVPGPSPRAFHVAVAIDCNMFIFGGRSGRRRLGDFWVLDTDTWQWSELTGYGEPPSARDFAAGASVGNGKVVIYGGWDGSKWLSDVYVLDTMSLEWRQLVINGPLPPPRCGHTATMVEKRLLIFGGRGGGGPTLGDLWALKGLFDEEREPPGWTQLKLPGSAPSARCGHSTTSGGLQLVVFGGHGTAGWLTRYDVYHNDCIVLDRASVQWKRLPVTNEPPPARAYHSLTQIGSRFLLFGGYDGKSTFGDIWWLVSEDDILAKRAATAPTPPPMGSSGPEESQIPNDLKTVEAGRLLSPLNMMRHRLGLPVVPAFRESIEEEVSDDELIVLARSLFPTLVPDAPSLLLAVRKHWASCDPRSVRLKELGPMLRDYGRLIAVLQKKGLLISSNAFDVQESGQRVQVHRFYHLESAKQVRMDDTPSLLTEYKQLLHLYLGESTREQQEQTYT